jgi:predicted esterase
MGSEDNALIPWRSAAADPAFVKHGTWIYSPAHDGLKLQMKSNTGIFNYITNPKYMGLDMYELFAGNTATYEIVHNGCFRVDDTGVSGSKIDIFAAKQNLYSQASSIGYGTIIIGDAKCGPPDVDKDDDGIQDDLDNCPDVPNPDQLDEDYDKIGNACEPDTDKDGVIDDNDNCLEVANADQLDEDGDGIGNACEPDRDGDGIIDDKDNCPAVYNVYQEDKDDDGVGDLCEVDADLDGIVDDYDNCKLIANADQADADLDGVGDACEPDTDADGVIDDNDNCPLVSNFDQADVDKDGIGNVCEPDRDWDGIIDDNDNCDLEPNVDQKDTDGDGQGDACDMDIDGDSIANAVDNCPFMANETQVDTDLDGLGDVCDADIDNDTIPNGSDNCPLIANPGQADRDHDGLGDACETDVDSDGDGYYDNQDNCPDVYNPDQLDLDGDGIGYRCDSNTTTYYQYCGDEEIFNWEEQAAVAATAESATNHQLLPPVVVDVPDNLNSATIVKDAIYVTKNGVRIDVTADVVTSGSNMKLQLKRGAGGALAWDPDSSYVVKLCHHIKTQDGRPIKPVSVTVGMRPSGQQENIGISHSGGGRSGVFYVPKNFDSSKTHPIVLLLHGLGGNGAGMVSAFQALADQYGAILVGPDGFLRTDPFNVNGTTYYFNPNYKNTAVEDYTFMKSAFDKIYAAFNIDNTKVLVAGMSMGGPATLFAATKLDKSTHGAMLHSVRWNFDRGNKNDVANFLWYDWEVTPVNSHKVPFWYSTSTDDWVTNYTNMSVPSFMKDDVGYLRSSGLSVVEKKNYTGGHTMGDQEKSDLFKWFLFGTLP